MTEEQIEKIEALINERFACMKFYREHRFENKVFMETYHECSNELDGMDNLVDALGYEITCTDETQTVNFGYGYGDFTCKKLKLEKF